MITLYRYVGFVARSMVTEYTRCYVLLCGRWSFLLVARYAYLATNRRWAEYINKLRRRTDVRKLEIIVSIVSHCIKKYDTVYGDYCV